MYDFGGSFFRSYSIASGNTDSFTLTVKLLKKGRGGRFLRKVRVGKKLSFMGGLGQFYLQDSSREKVFIATGTGLAPMIAMLQATPEDIKKTVLFGARYEDDIYYKDILESFPNTKIHYIVSRPSETYTGDTGRVTDYLDTITPESEVYICGNPAMVDSVKTMLSEKGYSQELIFNEKFVLTHNPTKKHATGEKLKSLLTPRNIAQLFAYYIIPGFLLYSVFADVLQGISVYEKVENYGALSWALLYAILLVKPLAEIINLKLFHVLVSYRRELGVLSFWFAVLHSVALAFYLEAWSADNIEKMLNPQDYYLYGILAFFGMFILGVTSNKISLARLKGNWKKLHFIIIYPTFVFVTMHFAKAMEDTVPYYFLGVLLVLKAVQFTLQYIRSNKS